MIAVELQGHGHTADIDRPLTYEQMADDTVALLKELKIEQADFFGYSMGGTVGLAVAIRHPGLVVERVDLFQEMAVGDDLFGAADEFVAFVVGAGGGRGRSTGVDSDGFVREFLPR